MEELNINPTALFENLDARLKKVKTNNNRMLRRRECKEEVKAISTITTTSIHRFERLNTILFYQSYSQLTPQILMKYQTVGRCYHPIAIGEECFHCLNCSLQNLPYLVCTDCAQVHKDHQHLLLPLNAHQASICRCGDFLFESKTQNMRCCHHQSDSLVYTNENKALVIATFERIRKIAQIVIPELLVQFGNELIQAFSKEPSPDTKIYIFHVIVWLCQIVRINVLRPVCCSVHRAPSTMMGCSQHMHRSVVGVL